MSPSARARLKYDIKTKTELAELMGIAVVISSDAGVVAVV
jgi:hypothetical protein